MALGVVACDDVTNEEVFTQPDGAVLTEDVTTGQAALDRSATVEIEFEATWDHELQQFDIEALSEHLNTPNLEMRDGLILRENEQGLYCELRVTQGRPDTVGISTDFVGLNAAACGYTGFPYEGNTFCADISVSNFYSVGLTNTYAELTQVAPDTGHNGYAFPLGTGANPAGVAPGNNAPNNALGLWSYGEIDAAGSESARWVMEFTPEPFSFRGRIVATVAETCDERDNDCDDIIDEGARCYAETEACTENIDCQSFNCDAGFCGPVLPEECTVVGDEDGDGFLDCNDSDCSGLPGPGGVDCPSCGVPITEFGVYTGTNLGQGDDTDVTGSDGEDYAWFFTAPADANYTFETCGSNFDTRLEIFDGTCTAQGNSLGANDDACGAQSRVTIAMTAGQEVMAVVDGFGGATGDIVFRVSTDASEASFGPGACIDAIDNNGNGQLDCNDPSCALVDGCPAPYGSCDNPAALPLGQLASWSVSEDTADLTAPTGTGPNLCPFSQNGNDRAFLFVAPDSGDVTITFTSTGDASLYMRSSCATDVGDTLCVDSGFTGDPETITFTAVAGESYYIIADHFGTATTYEASIILTASETYGSGTCDDTIDGDGDGLTDCEDSDCANEPACFVAFPYTEDFNTDNGGWFAEVVSGDAAFEYNGAAGEWSTFITTVGDGDWVTLSSPVIDLTAPGQAPTANVRLNADLAYEFEPNYSVAFVTFVVDGDVANTYVLLPGATPYDTTTVWNGFDGWGGSSNGDGSIVSISEELPLTAGASTLQVIFNAFGDSTAFDFPGLRIDSVSVTEAPAEDCTDGIDNSLDGRIDCQDPQCTALCSAEICDNGIDDETAGGAFLGDGFTDCGDAECFTDAACLITIPVDGLTPYAESFEANDGGWFQGGGFEWGAPAGTIINTASDGVNVWMTDLDAPYVLSTNYALLSKRIDFGPNAGQNLYMTFDYFLVTEDGWDELELQVSTDDGATFALVTTAVSGFDASGEVDTDTGGWVTATIDMTPYAGESEVRVQFVFASDGSTIGGDGAAIDNIEIGVTPDEICDGLGGDEDGDGDIDCADSDCWTLGGGCTEVCDGFGFDEDGDGDSDCDDADCAAAPLCFVIDTFPYSADFGTSDEGWATTGSVWEYGVATTFDFNANGVTAGWVTDLDANYPSSANTTVVSPTFDFSGLGTDPFVSFDYFVEMESCCDDIFFDLSLDGGTTWTEGLGNYIDNSFASGSDLVEVTGGAGEAAVKFRFRLVSDSSLSREGFALLSFDVAEPVAEVAGLNCQDGIDNNFDGATDCQDAACGSDPGCVEVCDGLGFDEDGDGDADCADTDCSAESLCITEVTSFPYTTDFSAGPEGWTETAGTLWAFGTATTTDFAANGVTQGWVTNLTGDYTPSTTATITSPAYNLSGAVADVTVLIEYFVEMESCCDDIFFDVSLDDGGSWTQIGNYNNNSFASDSDAISIAGSAGVSAMRLRLRLVSDSSVQREGFALLGLTVAEPVPEVAGAASCTDGLDNDLDGLSDCADPDCFGAACTEVCDGSALDEDGDAAADCADSDCWVLGGICGEICTGGDDEDGDGNTDCADSDCDFDPACAVITIPYAPDFDASAGGWSVIAGDWAWGAPAQTAPLNAAPAGSTNVWMTGLSANYANSTTHIVESPIIDASATTNNLQFTFKLAADVESGGWDEFGVEFSVDGGATWVEPAPTALGTWTTDTGGACAVTISQHCWEDDITSWTEYTTLLPGTAGAADLRIRVVLEADSGGNGPGIAFDDVSITEYAAPPEICDDAGNVDEDLDGDANCADSDCSADPSCAGLTDVSFTYSNSGGNGWCGENSWSLADSGGTTLLSVSGTSTCSSLDVAAFALGDGCYTVTQVDSFPDGWNSNGVLTIAAGGSTLAVTSTFSGASNTTTFGVNTTCP